MLDRVECIEILNFDGAAEDTGGNAAKSLCHTDPGGPPVSGRATMVGDTACWICI